MTVRLYLVQRATAALMVPLIAVHLVLIVYATRKGLSAADILARTRGSVWWGAGYTLFVLAAAAHGGIGLRTVAHEWLGIGGRRLDGVLWGAGLLLAGLGLRAVWAVVVG